MDIFHILRAQKVCNIFIQTTQSLTQVYMYTFKTINVCKCIVDNTYSCLQSVAINVDRQMDIIKS